MIWVPSKSPGFSILSFYKFFGVGGGGVARDCSFPWKVRAPCVRFFVCSTVKGKILTTDNLQKRGFVIPDWCVMCKADGEDVEHLFSLHCTVAGDLWAFMLTLIG